VAGQEELVWWWAEWGEGVDGNDGDGKVGRLVKRLREENGWSPVFILMRMMILCETWKQLDNHSIPGSGVTPVHAPPPSLLPTIMFKKKTRPTATRKPVDNVDIDDHQHLTNDHNTLNIHTQLHSGSSRSPALR
jgi:hypothetical protein